ncbi:MAG: FAD-binding oxidoreductase [Deltaproteobacteria bacterium]|nr:FAD-binding oxidoreductase [Deltaproteobacteria bacterium]
MSIKKYDVVIVGGGVMGSSTAYHLVSRGQGIKAAVIERDPTYQFASSALSMANIRIQFSLKENIQVSLYAFEALDRFEEEMEVEGERPAIAFHREGNLFLYDQAGLEEAQKALALQRELGAPVEWWPVEKIEKKYPLYDLAGLSGGVFGPKDGHLDAYAMLMGYKNKARSLGASYIRDEATELLVADGRIEGVRTASGETYSAGVVVNCAGAWCADLAKTAGITLPVEPVKRQVFSLDVAVKPNGPLPLTILPSGMYFRTETGDLVLLGKSLDDDPVGYDFNWDRDRFMNLLWPELAEFVPAWETLKLVRGWAGLYAENRLDGNAILGEWPDLKGFYLANGFSGHGLQQSPAVGRFLAEQILGLTPSLDLSIFRPERILEKRPLVEDGLV